MGIGDFEAVVVEGVDAIPDRAEEFKSSAIKRALNMYWDRLHKKYMVCIVRYSIRCGD